jgi:DNA polymerase-3 subunit alpha
MNPAPLHDHSMWSQLDGWSTPEEMAQRAVQIGACGCGISDHGNVAGHLEFAKATHKYDIKPVFGVELYHGLKPVHDKERDQAHLIAFAQNDEGLRNLWRLVNQTGRNDHFHHVGRVFWDDLEKYKDGITFTSACALGLVPREIVKGNYDSLNRYLDILRDNFFIEISTYPGDAVFKDKDSEHGISMRTYNEALVDIAHERGIPIVYGDDGHYSSPDQFVFHDAYLARQTNQSVYTPIEDRTMYHPPNAVVIKDIDMIYENLSYLPVAVIDEAVNNANVIIQRASAQLPEIRRHLPVYLPSTSPWVTEEQKQLSPEELFINLVTDGIHARYGDTPSDAVWERTFYEVETLIRDGIHHYFLMGWDEMKIADELGIERGPGRGSSGGSIVAYALSITDVCPLHYGLIFERFWNSGRVDGFPDIDSDFSRARRGEMIEALRKRWGNDRVVAIGTTGYLKPKAVIDKLSGACEITYKEVDELKGIVGRTTKIEILGHEQIGWNPDLEPGKKYYVKDDVGEDIIQWINADPERADKREYFVLMCEATCSRVSQYGVHASGLVISDVDTDSELPAQIRGGKDGVPATMFTMSDVDKRMFVKLDILGLRTLDVLAYWKNAMKDGHDIDIQWSGLDRQDHPDDMWKMIHQGFTAGIFQVEDGYGRQLCKRMLPNSIMDLAVIGALNRPGPIQAGIPDNYIARRNGEQEVSYPHPRFEELMAKHLDNTYGLWCFQEQIINYFNELGYTKSESDAIRKIMGKKKPEQMDAVRDGGDEWEGRGYLHMAVEAGIPLDIAERIWEDLEGFADYCFNLSHSVVYGVITFRTVFAKYYGAPEFYAAVIRSLVPSSEDGDSKKKTSSGDKRKKMLPVIVQECRRLGIDIQPPDIRYSKGYTYAEQGSVYLGFSEINTVRASGSYIVELRDKHNLDISTFENFQASFNAYNDSWNASKKAAIKAGIGEDYASIRSPKQRLGAKKIVNLGRVGAWNNIVGMTHSMTEQQEIEEELLECVLTDNSLEILESNLERISECDDYADVLMSWVDKAYDVEDPNSYIDYMLPGVITNIDEKIARKSGEPFGILTVTYEENEIEFIVYATLWKRVKPNFKIRTPGIFEIRQGPDTQWGPSYVFRNGSILK